MSQFVARNGIISRNNAQVTGSLLVSGSTTLSGSVAMPNLGTSSNTNYIVIDTGTGALTYRTVAPGSSGTGGTSGSSGTAGTSGSSGTSGAAGAGGSSGTSGVAGAGGSSGTSGSSGSSGSSGTSGAAGAGGSSGTSGSSGSSGTSGAAGAGGSSGTSGTGFSTITNAVDNRVLTSLGTANTANAEANLTFDGSLLQVTGSIRAGIAGNSSANTRAIGLTSTGTGTSQAAIGFQQITSDGDTIIFADFEPFVEYNFMHENDQDRFIINGGSSTNSLEQNTFYNLSGNARTGYAKFIFTQADGNFFVGGNIGVGKPTANSKLDINGNTIITGSLTVITGSSIEFRVTNTGVNIGNIVTDIHTLTGSLNVSGSITGSLLGTASFAITASHALNSAGGGGGSAFPFTGSALITGSLGVRGNTTITGSLTVSSSGVATSLIGSGTAVFSVDGTVGRLFQVDDSLTGSLFSVNTAGGVPLIEAFSDNTVRIGQFGSRVLFVSQSRVGIGKETLLNSVLDVSGSLIVTGSINVSGSITGSLFGTASFAITASHALNSAGGGGGAAFPHTGNAIITGSLTITTGSLGNNFPTLYTQGYTASVSGTISVVASNPTGSHRSAFYNYVATRGTSARAGQIAAVWYLTTCSFAEYVTTDIGTSADLDMTARISGGNVQLVALGSGSWIINTSVNLV